MPGPGFGADVGQNWGGGGIIYLTNLIPQPNSPISGDAIHFTIGVQGGLIDLSSIQIIVSSTLAFSGNPPTFSGGFATSSYSYSVPDNGYTFSLVSSFIGTVTIQVSASTFDGSTTTQTYQVSGPVNYPPTPFGVTIGSVSIDSFSGEAKSGILAGGHGQVFFGPAVTNSNTGSQIDLDNIETVAHAADTYNADPTNSASQGGRPWLWGPPTAVLPARVFPPDLNIPNYNPCWNSWNGSPSTAPFVFLSTTKSTITGILTNTHTGNVTVILLS